MVSSSDLTVDDYLASLPADRRKDIETIREVILKNLSLGYEEKMNWGMITYEIPLERYPNTYNGQPLGLVALAAQKNHIGLYLMNVYGNPEVEKWFKEEYQKSGKKLDMGKSCVRIKRAADLPLDLIGKTVAKTSVAGYIKIYEASRAKQ